MTASINLESKGRDGVDKVRIYRVRQEVKHRKKIQIGIKKNIVEIADKKGGFLKDSNPMGLSDA